MSSATSAQPLLSPESPGDPQKCSRQRGGGTGLCLRWRTFPLLRLGVRASKVPVGPFHPVRLWPGLLIGEAV